MKMLILRFVVVFFVIPGACFVAIRHLENQGFFNLDKIEIVVENTEAGPAYLNYNLNLLNQELAKYKSKSLFRLPMQEINQLVQNQKWIQKAQLSRSWPSQLNIRIRPEEIRLLYLNSQASHATPITKDGKLLDEVELPKAPDAVVLEGENFKDAQLRVKAAKVFNQIPATGSFSRKNISSMKYDQKDGFWMTLIKDGIVVKMGEDQIMQKSLRVGQVVDYLDRHAERAKSIDANLSKKVHVQLSK